MYIVDIVFDFFLCIYVFPFPICQFQWSYPAKVFQLINQHDNKHLESSINKREKSQIRMPMKWKKRINMMVLIRLLVKHRREAVLMIKDLMKDLKSANQRLTLESQSKAKRHESDECDATAESPDVT